MRPWLSDCGVQLHPGSIGWSKNCWIKPGVLQDGTPVAVKIYAGACDAQSNMANLPRLGRTSMSRAEPTREEHAEYAREMNIVAGTDG